MSVAQTLHTAVELVCPIQGVSVGRKNDKTTWRINYKQEATPAQRAAAQAVVDALDVAVAEQSTANRLVRASSLKTEAASDPLIDKLRTASPEQIKTYINNNATDFASLKAVVIKLAVAQAYSLRDEKI